MRTLTTIQSATHVVVQCELEITASDQSTTWTFSHGDLINLPTVNWDIDFLGGLGKASNYQITLSSSIDFIKNNLSNFVNAEARLNVIVNSDAFQPHVGRIRQFTRDARDPNIINFTIYDRFLDTNPKYPVQTLQQSYSTLHPDVITKDWGYPVYFGKHTRPFYHVPVDCSIGTLLGPRQVSSENHVNSVWFNSNLNLHYRKQNTNNVLMTIDWNQESGSDNTLTSSLAFSVREVSSTDRRLFQFERIIYNRQESSYTILSEPLIKDKQPEILDSSIEFRPYLLQNAFTFSGSHNYISHAYFQVAKKINSPVKWLNDIRGGLSLSGVGSYSSLGTSMRIVTDDLYAIGLTSALSGNFPFTSTISVNVNSSTTNSNYAANLKSAFSDTDPKGLYTPVTTIYHLTYVSSGIPPDSILYDIELDFYVSLRSDAYRNYSIYSIPVNCSDIAYSENPVQIVEQLCNQASISYNQSQSSASQVLTTSYNMQCYFGEREEITDIFDEFGKISKTYMWIADSGTLNMKTYENSDAANIDTTITTSDMLSFRVEENPLGISRYRSQKASQFKVDYQYDFQRNRYDAAATAYPTDNAFCNSAFASGAEKQIVARTRYIMESDTAGYYLNSLVKKHTQSEEFVHLILPARFMGLEIADIVKIQHPMLVGSESVYQVTHVRDNFQIGQVSIRAQELLDV